MRNFTSQSKKKSIATRFESLEQRQMLAAQWSEVIDNPYFPLLPGAKWVYKGTVDGSVQKVRTEVVNEPKTIDGVACTTVFTRHYVDGALAEKSYDYFAQDKAGNVWNFGEFTRDFENGRVTSRAGSFEAGVSGAKAGIIMLAKPGAGDAYQQELAVNVAEGKAKVLSTAARAIVPFATYFNCVQTEDSTRLDPGVIDHKYFAPGIGLLFAETVKGGQEVLRLQSYALGAAAFITEVNNPYFPLTPGTTTLFKGLLEGAPEKVRTTVTHDRKMIDGVSTMVVFDRVFVNGALKEKTYDYYAQDKVGNVWYFGEDTKEYENGVVVSTHGTFEAGVDGAKAGIIMPARPDTGLFYNEENAVGVAQDQAKVIGVHQTAKTHFGTFGDCIMTENTTPLDPTAKEQKYYAAGFGPVYSQDISGGQDILRLVSITFEK